MSSFDFLFDGETVVADIEKGNDSFNVTVDGKFFTFRKEADNLFSTIIDGQKSTIAVVAHDGTYYIDYDSHQLELRDPADDTVAGSADAMAGEKDKIYAPMPGKIVKILVAVGDTIKVKQPMVVVEAMKMENQVNSRAAGVVKAINFSDGDQVDTESPIIELELDEE